MSPDQLLDLFDAVAGNVAAAVAPMAGAARRARTDRPGQYALDVVADAAALDVLRRAPLAIVSEESGRNGPADAAITVVIDPVDGSTNCSRGIPYWATSLCALDADGPVAALVVNHATGVRFTAIRDGGAWRDGVLIQPSRAERPEEAVVALAGLPPVVLPWRQVRALGSAALALCDVAAGTLEAFLDASGRHAPWDYLGGLLVCTEAKAVMFDLQGRDLVTTDPDVRRQVVAACTPALAAAAAQALGR